MVYRLLLICFVVCLSVSPFTASADTKQQKIKAQISKANIGLKQARQKADAIASDLKKNESKINRLSRKQYQTEKKIASITQQMVKSNRTKQQLNQEIKVEKEALAKQLLAMYSSGEESHLRLLLKQDDPSDISRTTKYFEYLNRSRLKRIQGIRERLTKAEALEKSIIKDKADLQKLQASLSSDKLSLKRELDNNARALKKSKSVVVSRQSKLNKLKKQEAA